VSDAVALPMDVVKQRLQLPDSPYRGVWECILRVSREEGMGAFFRSYQTTLAMNVPYTMVHFAVYEGAKQALGNADDLEERLLTHVAAGGSAGGIAAAITTPLDVVKTRLQTDCALRSKELVHAPTSSGLGWWTPRETLFCGAHSLALTVRVGPPRGRRRYVRWAKAHATRWPRRTRWQAARA